MRLNRIPRTKIELWIDAGFQELISAPGNSGHYWISGVGFEKDPRSVTEPITKSSPPILFCDGCRGETWKDLPRLRSALGIIGTSELNGISGKLIK